MKTSIKLRRRKTIENANLPESLPNLLRRLYANRGIRNAEDLELNLKSILPWQQLSGIENATSILYEALYKGIRIVVVGDFDTDGATSTALVVLCLQAFGYTNIVYLVPNRFKDGYGLSPDIVNQAQSHGAQMIITVDNGISSYTAIEHAQKLGIQVLVTDHHLPDSNLPAANAIINPNLNNCNFQSKSLAGVGVTFYLMLALRAMLRDKNWFNSRRVTMPNLANYLDLVALGTVADAVPFDLNNRILISQGLNRIQAGRCRPGIKALIEISNCDPQKISVSDISFSLSPLLNAAGRLDDMSTSIALLLCENISEARVIAGELDVMNKTRREIEQEMQVEALVICEKLEDSYNVLPNGLAIYHPNWHQGIVGILASRIKEKFYRPVIAFASVGNGMLKGSGRSIQGLHMRDMLKHLDDLHPNLITSFGGHEMAVGLLLEENKFNMFQRIFNELATDWIDPTLLQGEIISDGELAPVDMTIETAYLLKNSGPWGKMFPEPLFDGRFRLLYQNIVGKHHLKVIVKPINGGPLLNGIAFNIDTTIWPNKNVSEVELAYKLDIHKFRDKSYLQLIIDYIWPM